MQAQISDTVSQEKRPRDVSPAKPLPRILRKQDYTPPYGRPPDVEEFVGNDGLTHSLQIHDPGPAHCATCGAALYPRSCYDCTDLSPEEMEDLAYDLETFRSVMPCESHPTDPVIWAPVIELSYIPGVDAVLMRATQNGLTAPLNVISPAGFELTNRMIARMKEWAAEITAAEAQS